MKIQIIYLTREGSSDTIEHKMLTLDGPAHFTSGDLITYITDSLEDHENKRISFDLHSSLLSIAYVILDNKLLRLRERQRKPMIELY